MKRKLKDNLTKSKKVLVKFDTLEIERQWYNLENINNELYKRIKKSIEILKIDPWHGTFVKDYKKKKEFKRFWKYPNLWKYPLTKKKGGIRLIYTIKESEIIILSIIIEWGLHDKYKNL